MNRKSPELLFDLEAEQAVLASILLEPERLDEVPNLAPEHFSDRNGKIFRSIRRMAARGVNIDSVTLAAQLNQEGKLEDVGGHPYLADLINRVVTAAFVKDYANVVYREAVKRATAIAATKIAAIAYDSEGKTPDEIITAARSKLAELLEPNMSARDTPIDPPGTWADIENILAPLVWDWQNWLPRGHLVIVSSASGEGKSAIMLRVAACYLRGDSLPDGQTFCGSQGLVLWGECEAAQAINLGRAQDWNLPYQRILTPFGGDDVLQDPQLDLPEHQRVIASHFRSPDVKLLIVDSLRGAHSGDENSSETIGVTKFLAELARDTGKPVLLSHHLRKRGQMDGDVITLDQLRGSSAIAQLARIIWGIDAPDPTHKETKRLSVIKSNLARFPTPLGFEIDQSGVRFVAAPEPPKEDTLTDRAADLLELLLAEGAKPATKIEEEFKQAGISMAAANRAKKKLGVIAVKPGGVWHWSYPAKEEIP